MAQDRILQIEGFDELLQALRDAPEEAEPFVREAMLKSLMLIEGPIKLYPPATQANSPSRPRWYERGYGPKWRTRAGAVHGQKTSERLGSRWVSKVEVYRNGLQALNIRGPVVEGILGNNAGYAMVVQSKDKQAQFHAQRGWPTLDQAMDDAEEDIHYEFEDAVDRWVYRFNNP